MTKKKAQVKRLLDLLNRAKGRRPETDQELDDWLATPEGKAATAFELTSLSRWEEDRPFATVTLSNRVLHKTNQTTFMPPRVSSHSSVALSTRKNFAKLRPHFRSLEG